MAKMKRYSARDSSGKLLQERFANPKDGREWQAKIRREKERIRAGMDLPFELRPMTVKDYASVYMQRREKGEVIGKVRGRKRKPAVKGTWITEGQRLEDYIIPEVGGRLLGSISTEEWERIFEKIQKKPARHQWRAKEQSLSDATMNRIRALMSRLYEDAIIEHVVNRNPIRETAARDEGDPSEKSDFWTIDECRRFLAVAEEQGPQFYCWSIWALNTGSRVNEMLAVQHKDVDFVGGFVEIRKIVDLKDKFAVRERTKGKKTRIVGMNRAMRDAYSALVESLEKRPDPSDFVFKREDGRPISYYHYRDVYKHVCRSAQIKCIRIHDFRHTYASQFMMAGGSLEALKEVLGHSGIATTQRYAKFSPEHIKKQSSIFEVDAPKDTSGKVTPLKKK